MRVGVRWKGRRGQTAACYRPGKQASNLTRSRSIVNVKRVSSDSRARRVPARQSKPGARVTRTFLFSDLREYTAFTEAKGDAAAARLLHDYRVLMRREIARHVGAELKTEGDSFYVVFEAASAALECAVGILRQAAERDSLGSEGPLRIGIGVHVGEAVPHDGQYVGLAVNIAARLAAKADAGEIVVSEALRALVAAAYRDMMRDRGPLRLKGIGEPVRSWSVVWEESASWTARDATASVGSLSAPAPIAGQVLCPAVIGREKEFAELAQRLTRAALGSSDVLLVGGEAGVGKSAYVRRLQAMATESGARILSGQTDELAVGLPYAPFVSAIRSAFRALPRERLARIIRDVAPELVRLFPELGPDAADAPPSSSLERNRLSIAFRDLFRAFAGASSMVLVLEDLHWADEASLELLRYLARELRDAPILIVGTYRSDELHRRHPLTRALSVMQRERLITRLDLRRLGRDETGEMIRLTLGRSEPVPDTFLDAVYRRCEGNPFFAEELLRALVERGDIVLTDGRWDGAGTAVEQMRIPESIVETVRARVNGVDADVRGTLDAAAVIGVEFPSDLLGILKSAVDPRQLKGASLTAREREVAALVSEGLTNKQIAERLAVSVRTAMSHVEQLRSKLGFGTRSEIAAWMAQSVSGAGAHEFEDHLRALIELQLISQPVRGTERYSFRHALTREVVYDDLLPSERKRLHKAVAEALAQSALVEPALIAHHFIAAGASHQAVPHLLRAAGRARGADAPRETAGHYKRAIEIGVPAGELAATLERLAEAYAHFDVALAAKVAEEAKACYQERGDARGASRALLLASRAWRRYSDGVRATALAKAALDALRDEEPSLELGRATAHLADIRAINGAWAEAIDLADRAIALGERFADPWTMANALITKGRALRFVSTEEALALILRGRDLGIQAGLTETTLPGYTIGALVMGFLRRPREERLAFVSQGLAYAHQHGIEESAHLEYMKATLVAATGDWDDALAIIGTGLESNRQYLLALEAVIRRGRDGPGAALPLSLEVAERGVRADFAWDFLWALPQAAVACMLAGQEDAARRWLDRVRTRLDTDADARTQMSGGAGFIAAALVAALLLEQPEWFSRIESAIARRSDPAVQIHAAELRAVRSILNGDPGSAPGALETLFEPGGEEWGMVGSGGAWRSEEHTSELQLR